MLIPLPNVEILEFFLGESNLFVNHFVKTRHHGYHKIMIPTQHKYKPFI
jgi:hypothetical protein